MSVRDLEATPPRHIAQKETRRTMDHVLLTDPLHPEAHARLARWARISQIDPTLSRDESDAALRAAAGHVDGLIVRRPLPDDLFEGALTLRGVVRHGVGLDYIPVDRATAHGVPVGYTPGVNANAVAEYVFAALLAQSRRLAAFDRDVRDGAWTVRMQAGARTWELQGRRLGVVGYGAIGERIGAIGRHGFGMSLAVCTRSRSRVPADVPVVALAELFGRCDVVVLACPLTPETRGMVDRAVLRHAGPETVLVNVGRGALIIEDDLCDSLAAGELGGAALDVFERQPLPAASRLFDHPRVLLTPHVAGMTREAERAMGCAAVDTLEALLGGRVPQHIVNPEVCATRVGPAGLPEDRVTRQENRS